MAGDVRTKPTISTSCSQSHAQQQSHKVDTILQTFYQRTGTLEAWIRCTDKEGALEATLVTENDHEGYKHLLKTTLVAEKENVRELLSPVSFSQVSHQQEIVVRAVQRVMRREGVQNNVLSFGFGPMTDNPKASVSTVHGIEYRYPNSSINRLQYPVWKTLLSRVGDMLMSHLLENTSVFILLVKPAVYLQVTGEPVYQLWPYSAGPSCMIRQQACPPQKPAVWGKGKKVKGQPQCHRQRQSDVDRFEARNGSFPVSSQPLTSHFFKSSSKKLKQNCSESSRKQKRKAPENKHVPVFKKRKVVIDEACLPTETLFQQPPTLEASKDSPKHSVMAKQMSEMDVDNPTGVLETPDKMVDILHDKNSQHTCVSQAESSQYLCCRSRPSLFCMSSKEMTKDPLEGSRMHLQCVPSLESSKTIAVDTSTGTRSGSLEGSDKTLDRNMQASTQLQLSTQENCDNAVTGAEMLHKKKVHSTHTTQESTHNDSFTSMLETSPSLGDLMCTSGVHGIGSDLIESVMKPSSTKSKRQRKRERQKNKKQKHKKCTSGSIPYQYHRYVPRKSLLYGKYLREKFPIKFSLARLGPTEEGAAALFQEIFVHGNVGGNMHEKDLLCACRVEELVPQTFSDQKKANSVDSAHTVCLTDTCPETELSGVQSKERLFQSNTDHVSKVNCAAEVLHVEEQPSASTLSVNKVENQQSTRANAEKIIHSSSHSPSSEKSEGGSRRCHTVTEEFKLAYQVIMQQDVASLSDPQKQADSDIPSTLSSSGSSIPCGQRQCGQELHRENHLRTPSAICVRRGMIASFAKEAEERTAEDQLGRNVSSGSEMDITCTFSSGASPDIIRPSPSNRSDNVSHLSMFRTLRSDPIVNMGHVSGRADSWQQEGREKLNDPTFGVSPTAGNTPIKNPLEELSSITADSHMTASPMDVVVEYSSSPYHTKSSTSVDISDPKSESPGIGAPSALQDSLFAEGSLRDGTLANLNMTALVDRELLPRAQDIQSSLQLQSKGVTDSSSVEEQTGPLEALRKSVSAQETDEAGCSSGLQPAVLPLLLQFLHNHRKCRYWALLKLCQGKNSSQKSSISTQTAPGSTTEGDRTATGVTCKHWDGTSVRRPRKVLLPASKLLEDHVTPQQVFAFLQAVVKQTVPKQLFGHAGNLAILLKNVRVMLFAGKFERMCLGQLMKGMKVMRCVWLRKIACQKEKEHIMAQLVWWIVADFIFPIIRTFFYLTDTTTFRNRVLYYRKATWLRLQTAAMQEFRKAVQLQYISQAKVRELLAEDQTLGVSVLRFLPKAQSLRPIVNMSSKPKTDLEQNQSINKRLMKVFQALTFEKMLDADICGCSVFGLDDIFIKLRQFKEKRISCEDDRCLYFVKSDISKCFDSIQPQLLFSIVKSVLMKDGEQTYMTRKYASVRLSGNRVKRVFHSDTTRLSHFQPDFASFVRQQCIASGWSNLIVVDQALFQQESTPSLLQTLSAHLYSNVIKVGGSHYVQRRGISQGSVLSTLLASIYLAHLEHFCLPTCQDELLIRRVDDYLFVTPNKSRAERILDKMVTGFPDYNCFTSSDKILTNFPVTSPAGATIRHSQPDAFPWCGLMINTHTLELSVDYSRYSGLSITDTATFDTSHKAGQTLRSKVLMCLKIKCHIIFFDHVLNSRERTLVNTYQVLLFVAASFHSFVNKLPPSRRVVANPHFFFGTVKMIPHYLETIIKTKLKRLTSSAQFPVSHHTVCWMNADAFLQKLHCFPGYRPLRKALRATRMTMQRKMAKNEVIAVREVRQTAMRLHSEIVLL